MKKLAAVLVAAPVLLMMPASAPAVEDLPLDPGTWEASAYTGAIRLGRDKRCIQAEDVTRFIGGWSNSVYTCVYPTSIHANGQLVWKGTCHSRGGRRLDIEATGTYTQTAFRATGKVRSRLAGVDLTVPFRFSAKRLGSCTEVPAPLARRPS